VIAPKSGAAESAVERKRPRVANAAPRKAVAPKEAQVQGPVKTDDNPGQVAPVQTVPILADPVPAAQVAVDSQAFPAVGSEADLVEASERDQADPVANDAGVAPKGQTKIAARGEKDRAARTGPARTPKRNPSLHKMAKTNALDGNYRCID
jgi:hypothetical protein